MRVPGRGSSSSSATVRPTSIAETVSPAASSGNLAEGSTPASRATGSITAQFSMKSPGRKKVSDGATSASPCSKSWSVCTIPLPSARWAPAEESATTCGTPAVRMADAIDCTAARLSARTSAACIEGTSMTKAASAP